MNKNTDNINEIVNERLHELFVNEDRTFNALKRLADYIETIKAHSDEAYTSVTGNVDIDRILKDLRAIKIDVDKAMIEARKYDQL